MPDILNGIGDVDILNGSGGTVVLIGIGGIDILNGSGGTVILNGVSYSSDITYLIRDQFPVADPAPVATGRLSWPGPGTLTITDAENKLSISGGSGVFMLMETGDKYLAEDGDLYIIDI